MTLPLLVQILLEDHHYHLQPVRPNGVSSLTSGIDPQIQKSLGFLT